MRLRILSLAAGGEGVAHLVDGETRRTVFVPATAPGDLVDVDVDLAPSPARGAVRELVEASPSRVTPPCPLALECGGCAFMHLSTAEQARAHADIVRTALERAGIAVPELSVHAAEHTEHYRTRARLAVTASNRGVHLGYRAHAEHHIVDVRSCVVLDERLEEALSPLADAFASQRGHGEVRLALGATGRPVVDLEWEGELTGAVMQALEQGTLRGLWQGAQVRVAGARRPARMGDPTAETRAVDGGPLLVPAEGFSQVHGEVNRTLGERALALADPDGAETLELFAGSGNFSVALACRTSALTTVESDAEAVRCATANLQSRGLHARTIVADANLYAVEPAVRVAWLDPPRGGAAGAVRALAASRTRRIAYVSCHPSTLARDVAVLAQAGFSVRALELFEMFPHTSHMETLAVLERGRGRAPGRDGTAGSGAGSS